MLFVVFVLFFWLLFFLFGCRPFLRFALSAPVPSLLLVAVGTTFGDRPTLCRVWYIFYNFLEEVQHFDSVYGMLATASMCIRQIYLAE
jgi:hypothetical protein